MSAFLRATLGASLALTVAGCGGGGHDDLPVNAAPPYLKGNIITTTYDGTTNDLLTGGLGKTGLGTGACPAPANPASPTTAELRTIAICNNYRALVDVAANGGFGTLYGPNVDANGNVTTSEGKIAGEEDIVYADDGSGRQNVTLMVQIPAAFDPNNPCVVTATSSGSRGVYGAIGTAGEWGLKRGCAVAYTDKGSGNGYHDLAADAVDLIQGQRVSAASAGTGAEFNANLSAADLAAYNSAYPNRYAFKHAHSQQNPEATWGRDTLRSIEFAFYMLNQKYGENVNGTKYQNIRPGNTIVIASSVSNGAGAALLAAEQDTTGLIDGVAVGEPQIQVNPPTGLVIKRGASSVTTFGRTLYDYFTFANLYEPCASLATAAAGGNSAGIPGVTTPNATAAANRCEALANKGLVTGGTTTERANDALGRMLAYGWEQDSIPFMASHYSLATLSVTLTYADAYAKASVKDNLCGYSFAATPVNGVPPPLSAAAAAQLFATGNGVPPTSGINIVNNNSVGGAAVDAASISPSTGKADLNFDGALCLRDLLTSSSAAGTTLRASIEQLKATGNLHGKPAIIVQGRSDTLIPMNHTSRPYYALNKSVDSSSQLQLYEITNAQHFDAFIDNAAAPGYDSRLVPLHRYFLQAMDLMWAKLKNGAALPPSQVVHTTPRGGTAGAAPAITAANVPPISATPAAATQITISGTTLTIPD
ncbi:MAG TPA: 3-hydroxybutyrate oligomer hydrolase family protein [Usitatibacter sp.]|jgi:hydroxybutyrate-dimer hydrolase|nr:3-hydroxybutyrate oligomer hydrolase family protein [Usitatibacter sp.]